MINCRRILAIEAIEFGAFLNPLLTTDTGRTAKRQSDTLSDHHSADSPGS